MRWFWLLLLSSTAFAQVITVGGGSGGGGGGPSNAVVPQSAAAGFVSAPPQGAPDAGTLAVAGPIYSGGNISAEGNIVGRGLFAGPQAQFGGSSNGILMDQQGLNINLGPGSRPSNQFSMIGSARINIIPTPAAPVIWPTCIYPNALVQSAGGSLTVVAGASTTFTRTIGSFVSDGWVVGMAMVNTGFVQAGNNSTVLAPMTVTAVSATALTTTAAGTVNETNNLNYNIAAMAGRCGTDTCSAAIRYRAPDGTTSNTSATGTTTRCSNTTFSVGNAGIGAYVWWGPVPPGVAFIDIIWIAGGCTSGGCTVPTAPNNWCSTSTSTAEGWWHTGDETSFQVLCKAILPNPRPANFNGTGDLIADTVVTQQVIGPVATVALPTPVAPTTGYSGGAGTTTHSYQIAAVLAGPPAQKTVLSPSTTCTTVGVPLDDSNICSVIWADIAPADSYDIVKNGVTGVFANIPAVRGQVQTYTDRGGASTPVLQGSYSQAARNTTADINVGGQLTVGSVVNVTSVSEHDFSAYNSANLGSSTALARTKCTNASTLTADSTITTDVVGVGAGNYVAKLCTDGTTCAAGNTLLTCTVACTAATGTVTACVVTNAPCPAGTNITWGVATACATTDPGINHVAHITTP